MKMFRAADRKGKILTLPFIGMMLAELCLKLCSYMQMTLLPLFVIERNYSSAAAGLMSTAYVLSALLLRPVSGRMADEKGRYAASIFGAIIYCVATGLYFFEIPVTLLLVMRAIQGAGFSFDGTGIYALATDHIPESRMAEGIGYLGLAQTLATALAPTIALSLKNTFGYRTAFMVIFTLSALTLIIILLLRFTDREVLRPQKIEIEERPPAFDKPTEREPILLKLVDKNAMKPSLIILFVMFAVSTINVFLIPYATIGGIANPGVFFAVQAVMVFVARLTLSKARQRFGAAAVLISGMLLISLSLIGLVFRLSLPLLLFCGACFGLGIGVVHPQLNALAVLAADKENRGMANSTFFMMMDIGTAASGFIFGAVADAANYALMYAFAAAVSLGILLFLVMRRRELAA